MTVSLNRWMASSAHCLTCSGMVVLLMLAPSRNRPTLPRAVPSCGSHESDDEALPGRLDDFGGHDLQPVDRQDALDLTEEPLDQAQVSPSDPDDGRHRLRVVDVVWDQREPQLLP